MSKKHFTPIHPGAVLQDELEEEESLGAYGGVIIHLTPAVLVNIEGQMISQESILGAIEYHF